MTARGDRPAVPQPGARGAAVSVATAGFVTVLVGFSSSYAIVVQAAAAMGLDAGQLATLTAALALGMGLTTLLPSLWLRIPVVTAWSTPGAALLAVSLLTVAIANRDPVTLQALPQDMGLFLGLSLLPILMVVVDCLETASKKCKMPTTGKNQ